MFHHYIKTCNKHSCRSFLKSTIYISLKQIQIKCHCFCHPRGFPFQVLTTEMLCRGTSPVVQWLRLCASNSRGVGLILSLGTEIPHASWHNQSKKCSQEKSRLFPFAIIHILLLIFLISCPSYRPKYFKDGAASKLPCHLHPLLFVIWSSLGSEQWLPNFAFQWLFIILIIDLTAFDVIDFKRLFGGEKKRKQLSSFLVPYNTQYWFESSFCPFSAFLFGSYLPTFC